MNTDPYIMRDPTAERTAVIRQRLSPPPTLKGRKVALLSISKERSDEFLDTIELALIEHKVEVIRFKKPTHTKPAPEQLIQQIVESCDVVVEGLAD